MLMKATIGIDQSYTDTGIAIAVNGKIEVARSIPLHELDNDSEKRNQLEIVIDRAIALCTRKELIPQIYIEQPRINKGQTTFDYIKRAGAMEAKIVDICYMLDYRCYAIASNAWKSAIVGDRDKEDNSCGVPPQKWHTAQYTLSQGYDRFVLQGASTRTHNFIRHATIDDVKVRSNIQPAQKLKYNDNIGDAICIALYGELPAEQQIRKQLI